MQDSEESLSIAEGESETVEVMVGRRCEKEVQGPWRAQESVWGVVMER